jgi:hypothetical protein
MYLVPRELIHGAGGGALQQDSIVWRVGYKEFVSIRIPGSRRVFVKTGPVFHLCMMRGNCLQNWAVYPPFLPPEGTIASMERNVHCCTQGSQIAVTTAIF